MTTKKKHYLTPLVRVVKIDSCKIICASTEGYTINPKELEEDDWE